MEIIELEDGTKIDIYNASYNEIEKLAEQIVKTYMEENEKNIEDIDKFQDRDSIFYLVYNDISKSSMMAGSLFASVLKNKYEIDMLIA